MGHNHNVDLTPTLRELAPISVNTWHNFTRAGIIVGVGVSILLLFMLLVFVIL